MTAKRRRPKRTRYVCRRCGVVWVRGEQPARRCASGDGLHDYGVDRIGDEIGTPK